MIDQEYAKSSEKIFHLVKIFKENHATADQKLADEVRINLGKVIKELVRNMFSTTNTGTRIFKLIQSFYT